MVGNLAELAISYLLWFAGITPLRQFTHCFCGASIAWASCVMVEGTLLAGSRQRGHRKCRVCHNTLKSMVKTTCLVWPLGHCRDTRTARPQQSRARAWDVALGYGAEHLKGWVEHIMGWREAVQVRNKSSLFS